MRYGCTKMFIFSEKLFCFRRQTSLAESSIDRVFRNLHSLLVPIADPSFHV